MTKLNTVRKGDRAEYISQGIFSALGYSSQILRQEDYGIDFICTITESDKVVSYPTKSFSIQLKTSNENIVYNISNHLKIKWLFENNLPFFICYFDYSNNTINFYSTSPLNKFLFTRPKSVTKLSFQISQGIGESRVDLFSVKKGRKIFNLSLGTPFLSISLTDMGDASIIEERKKVLNKVIEMENENIVYRNLGLPFSKWLHQYQTNSLQILFGWAHFNEEGVIKSPQLLEKLGHIIMSLAYSFQSDGNTDDYLRLKYFVLKLPFEGKFKSALVNMHFRDENGNEV